MVDRLKLELLASHHALPANTNAERYLRGGSVMDVNYILGREQTSLYNAAHAQSAPARIAHEQLATAYGLLLAASSFSHRSSVSLSFRAAPSENEDRWADDGGSR